MSYISLRGQKSLTDFNTGIPDIYEDVYNAQTNPSGVISLALSENHLIHGPLTEFMNKNFNIDEATATTYAGTDLGGPQIRKAMADHVNKYFSPATVVEPKHVLMANGVSAICSMLGFLVGDPGDGVLLMRPIYGKFENDWGIMAGMKTLYTNMNGVDPFSADVVDCYEKRFQEAEAAGIKVRALQISNPHNPSGLCYPRSTLLALLKFCSKHTLHLISDEIYALTVFPTTPDATPFTSILALPLDNVISPNLVHAEYGFAKDFSASGLHLGCLITRNTHLAQAFQAIGLLHAPGGPSCHLGAAMLQDEAFVESLLALSRTLLAENHKLVTGMLDQAGIPYWKGGCAGYFLWINLSRFLPPETEVPDADERERVLAKRLFEKGVWLNPGQEKGEVPGWFRLVFSHPKGKVLEGVRRIIDTLCGSEKSGVALRTK